MLDSTNSDHDFANSIITGDESWIYGYGVEPIIFLTMKIHKNTKHYSLKCCLPSSDAIDKWGKFHACIYVGSRSLLASELH